MGSWFSNIHIRKTGDVTEASVAKYMGELMASRKYLPAESAQDADGGIAILTNPDSQWVTVCSDLLDLDQPEPLGELAKALSAAFSGDALGIACFDSDYLCLNLINTGEKTDAWLGIGSAAGLGMKRRSSLRAWKNKVPDYAAFAAAAKKPYVFAEEFLEYASGALGLPVCCSAIGYEQFQDFEIPATVLYFKLPEAEKSAEPPVLRLWTAPLQPCCLEKASIIQCLNAGGASKGIAVFFIGPYVETGDLTFSDVSLMWEHDGTRKEMPLKAEKVQLSDGQWAYYCHAPEFRLSPKVDDRLPEGKQFQAMMERLFTVAFVPHGNPRKILDITVVLMPDQNAAGQIGWNVWHAFGSKEAYIDQYNRRFGMGPPNASPSLRPEDYD